MSSGFALLIKPGPHPKGFLAASEMLHLNQSSPYSQSSGRLSRRGLSQPTSVTARDTLDLCSPRLSFTRLHASGWTAPRDGFLVKVRLSVTLSHHHGPQTPLIACNPLASKSGGEFLPPLFCLPRPFPWAAQSQVFLVSTVGWFPLQN